MTFKEVDEAMKCVEFYTNTEEEIGIFSGESFGDYLKEKFAGGLSSLVGYIKTLHSFISKRTDYVKTFTVNTVKAFGKIIITIPKGSKIALNNEDSKKIGEEIFVYESAGINLGLPKNYPDFYRAIVSFSINALARKIGIEININGVKNITLDDDYMKVSDLTRSGVILIDGEVNDVGAIYPIHINKDKVKFASYKEGHVKIINGKCVSSDYKNFRKRDMKGADIIDAISSNKVYTARLDSKIYDIISAMTDLKNVIEDIEKGRYKVEDETKLLKLSKEINKLIKVGDIIIDSIQVNSTMLLKIGAIFSVEQSKAAKDKIEKELNA